MSEIDRLKSIVEKLRAKDGCPWDRAQTHESLKPACIEEAAEVVCGINILTETGNAENLREELGDLLLQVMFHAVLAEEEGLFTFDDVAKTVADKMVRRHPHVFGGEAPGSDEERPGAREVSGSDEKRHGSSETPGADEGRHGLRETTSDEERHRSWEEIKKKEKEGREWQEPYLAAAMEEAKELIDTAERRKGFR